MAQNQDIDFILREWPYQPGVISARIVRAPGRRKVLQMRIELGLLQMEFTGRPDGERPGDMDTYLDFLKSQFGDEQDVPPVLTDEQCFEIDREFVQYYHRRICCLALREFDRAVADADHTLALMDFVAAHSPNEDWTASHERYRPFVYFHRTQALALAVLERSGPEAAIEEINKGLEEMRKIFVHAEAEEQFESDELVNQLRELKESLRKEYQVGQTLAEQLAEAVAAEEYERAARLRDEIARRHRSAGRAEVTIHSGRTYDQPDIARPKRHHPGRRGRHPAPSGHAGDQQAIAARSTTSR